MPRTEVQLQAARDAQRRYRERHPGVQAQWARENYVRRRKEVLDFLGAFCVQCDFKDERALEIDHIIPVRHRTLGRREWSREMNLIKEHSEQYQVLCANCHAIKTRAEI